MLNVFYLSWMQCFNFLTFFISDGPIQHNILTLMKKLSIDGIFGKEIFSRENFYLGRCFSIIFQLLCLLSGVSKENCWLDSRKLGINALCQREYKIFSMNTNVIKHYQSCVDWTSFPWKMIKKRFIFSISRGVWLP